LNHPNFTSTDFHNSITSAATNINNNPRGAAASTGSASLAGNNANITNPLDSTSFLAQKLGEDHTSSLLPS
jgi:hypothetical protein